MKNKEEKIKLQKFLQNVQIGSRRKCGELILQGKVSVNGKIAQIGQFINPNYDIIILNGKKIETLEKNEKQYIMLHKPRGFITTLSDEKSRKCIADLITDIPSRVFPIGRLDRDSEGLLLLTNDGDFANNIMHPSKQIFKTYRVTVNSNITADQATKLSNGIEIEGRKTLPSRVNVISNNQGRAVFEISISEGRNRQIRKMCESLRLEVIKLKRIAIGGLKLGTLKPGKWRNLNAEELRLLH